MKIYVLESPEKIKVVEKEIPDIKEDEVLIKVTNIGLCGSDIHLFKGTYSGPFKYPMLFGHEWSGIVSKVGNNVKKLKPGDKVTGDCSKYCGECDLCKFDKNLCERIEKFGITIDGASAEYIIRKERYIYKAPRKLDLDLICLAEPLAVSAHLISKIYRYLPNIKNKKILIYGGGAIGISALLILTRLYNCKQVHLFDIVKQRLELAKQLGADVLSLGLINDKVDNSKYNSIYSKAFYDLIIESTGNPNVFRNSLELIKPLGIIGCLGMIQEVNINQKLIVIKGLTIIGSIGGTGEFPAVLNFIKNNTEDIRRIISHKILINDFNRAFSISQNTSEAMKTQLILSEKYL